MNSTPLLIVTLVLLQLSSASLTNRAKRQYESEIIVRTPQNEWKSGYQQTLPSIYSSGLPYYNVDGSLVQVQPIPMDSMNWGNNYGSVSGVQNSFQWPRPSAIEQGTQGNRPVPSWTPEAATEFTSQ